MRKLILTSLVAVLTFAIGILVAACWLRKSSESFRQPSGPIAKVELNSVNESETTVSTPVHQSPIRSIDFTHFAFPNFPVYTREKVKHVTLKPGEVEPFYTVYGDVTGDGLQLLQWDAQAFGVGV